MVPETMQRIGGTILGRLESVILAVVPGEGRELQSRMAVTGRCRNKILVTSLWQRLASTSRSTRRLNHGLSSVAMLMPCSLCLCLLPRSPFSVRVLGTSAMASLAAIK